MNAKEMAELSNRHISPEMAKAYDCMDARIREAALRGERHTAFCGFGKNEEDAKEHYRKLGFFFGPTGHIGGVWQETEDIFW